jgi:hypothetical protein
MTTPDENREHTRIRTLLTEASELYAEPRRLHGEDSFRLACSVQLADALRDLDPALPAHLRQFWAVCREATLFEDVDYGQWGLRLFSAEASAVKTAEARAWMSGKLRGGDLVIGEFLGDLELLVCDTQSRGQLMVSLPLDRREDWHLVGSTVAEFLESYVGSLGKKFWVRRM